jgi:hypothetical protein
MYILAAPLDPVKHLFSPILDKVQTGILFLFVDFNIWDQLYYAKFLEMINKLAW